MTAPTGCPSIAAPFVGRGYIPAARLGFLKCRFIFVGADAHIGLLIHDIGSWLRADEGIRPYGR